MLFDDFDKKVKEAADHHHPAYDEKAWTKMEKLLDKHLPQEKDERRRIFFFLILFLLLGGGTFIYFDLGSSRKKNLSASGTEQKNTVPPASKDNNGKVTPSVTVNPAQDKTPGNYSEPGEVSKKDNSGPVVSLPAENNVPLLTTNLHNKAKQGRIKEDRDAAVLITERKKAPVKKEIAQKKVEDHELPDVLPNLVKEKNSEPTTVKEKERPVVIETGKEPPQKDDISPERSVSKEKPVLASENSDKKAKSSKQKKSSAFMITASAGPDISMVGMGKTGKAKLVGGVGLGYTFRERFTLRSGFYTARKVYTANPDEYHAPAGFNSYYPNLQKVEADCKVYEIPVSLSYNFKGNKKQNYFVSAGLSTYLMKRETYDFYFKYTASGPTVNREYTIYNRNKHHFAVLNLSGGLQRNFGKTVSVTAEPYVKVPLTGIGFGKVKLNSAGLLLSVAVKPFQPKAKK